MFRAFLKIIFSVTSLYIGNGCTGCSPSGRNAILEKQTLQNTRSVGNELDDTLVKNIPTKPSNESLSNLYQKYRTSVFMIKTSDGVNTYQGTGFFISDEGLAISNYHVFENTFVGLESIETYDRKTLQVKNILDKSDKNDYIIFTVELGNFSISNPLPISNNEPDIGQDVFAIGNPRGLESTLTKGIISGYRNNNNLIQTTTEITYGSSGSPLLNMNGQVVGITTSGIGEANINFAVNIKSLRLSRYLNY